MDIPPPFMEDGLDPSDPVPSGVDPSTISYVGEFFSTPFGFSSLTPESENGGHRCGN